MAEKLDLGTEERVLKIGQSFTNPKFKSFHTVRYDFKPASVDSSKKSTVDVGDNHQVTVTVPHLDGAGTTQTIFKGSHRPYTKECVLIVDRVTGEITLERLTCNIQVKKTRNEINRPQSMGTSSSTQQGGDRQSKERAGGSTLSQRSSTPPVPSGGGVGHRVSSKTRVTSGSRRPDRPITQLLPKHSPLRASPNQRSPGRSRDTYGTQNDSHNPSTLASLPMIGMDDFAPSIPSQPPPVAVPNNIVNNGKEVSPLSNHSDTENRVGTISDSSSSTSDSDSDSDAPDNIKIKNGYGGVSTNSNNSAAGSNTFKMNGNDLATLDEDLCLSESGSDSD